MNETEKTGGLEGMEDRLERVLNRIIDWVKYEEAKNAALITLDGVGAGVILQWLNVSQGPVSMALSICLKGSLAAYLISMLVSLFSFYPVIKGEQASTSTSRGVEGVCRNPPDGGPTFCTSATLLALSQRLTSKTFVLPLAPLPRSNWPMRGRSLPTPRSPS